MDKYNKYSNKYSNRNKGPRKNYQIKATEVRVITKDGKNLGVQSTKDAVQTARDKDLDLIEIAPKAKPPVCKILDYSKYMYRQNKKEQKAKNKKKSMKEFKFSPVIEEHDINIRVKRAKEYLEKGHNVRITVYRKGRHTKEQCRDMMKQVLKEFDDYIKLEERPREEKYKIFITLQKGT